MSIKAMAMAVASRRPEPLSLVRDSRDEQPINAIPKSSANSTKQQKIPAAGRDLPPVLRERQSVLLPYWGQLPDIVVALPQVVRGESDRRRNFPEPTPEAC
jgi:hypothetical protein